MYSQIKPFIRRYVRYAYLREAAAYRQALDRQRPQLRYVGWLGHKNFGDEILFQAFRRELFDECLLLPHDDFSPLSAIAAPGRAAAMVLGGGTLINDSGHLGPLEQAHREELPFFVFGTGVSDPEYWGKFPGARRVDVDGWLGMLSSAQYIGVRGPRSCAWLHAHGIANAEVIGDPALSISAPARPAASGEAPVLGVNLGTHDPVLGAKGADFNAVLELIRVVIARGWKVKYLAMHPIDQAIGQQLQQAVKHPAFALTPFNPDTQAMVREIGSCQCLVGERLHATIVACALDVPNITLSYQPKCLDFLESIGREDLAVKTDEVSGGVLIERFDWLQGCGEEIVAQTRARCDALRALQQRRAKEVVAKLQDRSYFEH
jgi:hypothetical protein